MKILIAEKDPAYGASLEDRLKTPPVGRRGEAAGQSRLFTRPSSASQALTLARESGFDLAVIGDSLQGFNAQDTVRKLKSADRDLDVVVLSSVPTTEGAVLSMNQGASAFLEKTWPLERIAREINAVLEKRSQRFKILEATFSNIALLLEMAGIVLDECDTTLDGIRETLEGAGNGGLTDA